MIIEYGDNCMKQWKFMNGWEDSKKGCQVTTWTAIDCVVLRLKSSSNSMSEIKESSW